MSVKLLKDEASTQCASYKNTYGGMMQAFHADVKEERSSFAGEWFTLKCFMGGWCCFPENGIPRTPLNSSTASTEGEFDASIDAEVVE